MSLTLWATEPGVPCPCAIQPLIHSINSPWVSTLEHGARHSGYSRDTDRVSRCWMFSSSFSAGTSSCWPASALMICHLVVAACLDSQGTLLCLKNPRVTSYQWRKCIKTSSWREAQSLKAAARQGVLPRSFRCHDGLANSQAGKRLLFSG